MIDLSNKIKIRNIIEPVNSTGSIIRFLQSVVPSGILGQVQI